MHPLTDNQIAAMLADALLFNTRAMCAEEKYDTQAAKSWRERRDGVLNAMAVKINDRRRDDTPCTTAPLS